MIPIQVETQPFHADNADFCRWEATSDVFPEIIGLGDTEELAIADFVLTIRLLTGLPEPRLQ